MECVVGNGTAPIPLLLLVLLFALFYFGCRCLRCVCFGWDEPLEIIRTMSLALLVRAFFLFTGCVIIAATRILYVLSSIGAYVCVCACYCIGDRTMRPRISPPKVVHSIALIKRKSGYIRSHATHRLTRSFRKKREFAGRLFACTRTKQIRQLKQAKTRRSHPLMPLIR